MMKSVKRIKMLSTVPRKYPATAPTTVPIVAAKKPITNIT